MVFKIAGRGFSCWNKGIALQSHPVPATFSFIDHFRYSFKGGGGEQTLLMAEAGPSGPASATPNVTVSSHSS
jgi:hypothetical protein